MNKNNTITLGSPSYPLTGLSTVNYKIYYWDYKGLTKVKGNYYMLVKPTTLIMLYY